MFHHYSSVKINKLYNNYSIGISLKPKGMWFAKPGAWKSACDYMGMSFGTNEYLYEIIKMPSNILYIGDIMDPEKFCEKYGTPYGIDWIDINKDGYSGVFIPNLSTKSRGTGKYGDFKKIPGGSLFFGVDCDSLCIWNTENLEIKQIDYKEGGLF